ncbi:MAG: hypothetical protein R2867_00040 [Caldilineaceae bacterium]
MKIIVKHAGWMHKQREYLTETSPEQLPALDIAVAYLQEMRPT